MPSGLVLTAVVCLSLVGTARADLGTNLRLYSSMDDIVPPAVLPAYWEDVSGNDHVALTNPSTYDGTADPGGTNRGTAVDFIGELRMTVDDGLNTDFDPGTGDYSFSLWYNETTTDSFARLLAKGSSGSSAAAGYVMASINGTPTLRMNDVNEDPTTTVLIDSGVGDISTEGWHHLVGVFDRTGGTYGTANQVLLYVDNAMEASAVLNDIDLFIPYDVTNLSKEVIVGGLVGSADHNFEGYMDDVAIYRGALSADDVNTLYMAPSLDASTITTAGITPVMIHNFVDNRNQQGVPAVVPDDYDGHDGTIYGDAQQVTDGTRGEVIEMDGEQYVTNEYVDYGDVLDPGADSYTATLWFKISATDAHQRLAGKGMMAQTTNEGWQILVTKDGNLYVRANYNDGDATSRLGVVQPVSYDQWHQVALVIDQENGLLRGYLDGLGSGTTGTDNGWSLDFGNGFTPGVDFVSSVDLLIGGSDKAPVNGLIDDFAVWDRALSDQEILDLFNGATFPSPPPPNIPGDATNDGKVDEADAQRLAQNWGAGTPGEPATWAMGNFDDDYFVGPRDAAILAANWGYGTSEANGVPEPSTILLLLGGFMAVVLSRRVQTEL